MLVANLTHSSAGWHVAIWRSDDHVTIRILPDSGAGVFTSRKEAVKAIRDEYGSIYIEFTD